eukprot:Rhum_TRINITY_DN20698_c0_g1::Rhum_TRINITY_DN20698_c0_g1_i1::g.171826::m.171826
MPESSHDTPPLHTPPSSFVGLKDVGLGGTASGGSLKTKHGRPSIAPAATPAMLQMWHANKGAPLTTDALAAYHTCYSAMCMIDDPYAQLWNVRFQDVLESACDGVPGFRAKKQLLKQLQDEFVAEVLPVAATIAAELGVADAARSVPSAGMVQRVYRHGGVVFYVWDTVAQAKCVLRAHEQVLASHIRGLTVPLCVVVVACGHALTATAGMQAEPGTREKKSASELSLLRRMSCYAGVPPHSLDCAQLLHGGDGRVYLTDVGGLTSLLAHPACEDGSFVRRRRNEATQTAAQGSAEGCCDRLLAAANPTLAAVVAKWMANPKEGPLRTDSAAALTPSSGACSVSSGLSWDPREQLYSAQDLVAAMHAKGLNLCMLGEARVIARVEQNDGAFAVLTTEIAARVVRKLMQAEMRSIQTHDPDIHLLFASRLLGAILENAGGYWEELLDPIRQELFPGTENLPLLPADTSKPCLFRRVCQLASFVYVKGSIVSIAPRAHVASFLRHSPLEMAVLDNDVARGLVLCTRCTDFDALLFSSEMALLMGDAELAERQVARS